MQKYEIQTSGKYGARYRTVEASNLHTAIKYALARLHPQTVKMLDGLEHYVGAPARLSVGEELAVFVRRER